MTKKFKVLITESNHGDIIIEAKNKNDAAEKAKQIIWDTDALILSHNVWSDTTVEVFDVAETDEELTDLEDDGRELMCVANGCMNPQTEDGEYCEKHYPKGE